MKPILLLILLLSCGACKARQTTVERWRSEIREMEAAAALRLETESDRELWESTRLRLAREMEHGRRLQRRVSVGRAYFGGGGLQGLHVFDVSDLVRGVTDFRAPIIGDLRRSGERGEREDGYVREAEGAFSEDALLEMITGSLLGADFEERGGSVTLVDGKLIIREP